MIIHFSIVQVNFIGKLNLILLFKSLYHIRLINIACDKIVIKRFSCFFFIGFLLFVHQCHNSYSHTERALSLSEKVC